MNAFCILVKSNTNEKKLHSHTMTKSGRILKGIGSFYTVLTSDGDEYTCKACGRFRKEKLTPCVGDNVVFEVEADGTGYMQEILQRRNSLVRPPVANIDKLIIVISASVPYPDFLLVDKLIAVCEHLTISPVLVINKCDEKDEALYNATLLDYTPTGYPIISVSAVNNDGINTLRDELAGSVCCFSGQSAVGKSSILNTLIPSLNLEVGGLTRKTDRGRHTTRHCELIPLDNGGAVFDTPGFSFVDFLEIEPHELCKLYVEMRTAIDECRFSSCMHMNERESDCAVKELLTCGKLSVGRYERYKKIASELITKYKNRYN